MAQREQDQIAVMTSKGGFDLFRSAVVKCDLYDTSSAVFEIAGDEAFQALEQIIAPGQLFQVALNGKIVLTGRAEVNEIPLSLSDGCVVSLTVRTKMSDARYASADPKVRFKNTSIKAFILALYAPLGYTAKDFNFDAYTDVDLVTGVSKHGPATVDLAPLKADSLKVNPPETIFDCGSRVLKRHHLMHWDASDGRINVGKPAISSGAIFDFRGLRSNGGIGNNIVDCRRVIDWSEVPSELTVFGATPGFDSQKAALRGTAVDLDLLAAAANNGHFNRRVIISNNGVKSLDQANAQAQRELAARSKRKNAWDVTTDGWTHWDGHKSIPYCINAMASMNVDAVGGRATGDFLVSGLLLTLNLEASATAKLTMVAPNTIDI